MLPKNNLVGLKPNLTRAFVFTLATEPSTFFPKSRMRGRLLLQSQIMSVQMHSLDDANVLGAYFQFNLCTLLHKNV